MQTRWENQRRVGEIDNLDIGKSQAMKNTDKTERGENQRRVAEINNQTGNAPKYSPITPDTVAHVIKSFRIFYTFWCVFF